MAADPPARVSGFKTQRLDHFTGLMPHIPGAAVMDIGCNRGLWSIQAALAGARLVHGCDSYRPGIEAARQVLADFPGVDVQFEIVDLGLGPAALAAFRDQRYDITLLLSVVHKLRRQMRSGLLERLIGYIGFHTELLVWRGYADEQDLLDAMLRPVGLALADWPVSPDLMPAAIWRRKRDNG